MIDDLGRFLTRPEAAAWLRERGLPISPATLATRVTRGGGPVAYRFGSTVVYPIEALAEWAEAQLRPAGRHASRAEAA